MKISTMTVLAAVVLTTGCDDGRHNPFRLCVKANQMMYRGMVEDPEFMADFLARSGGRMTKEAVAQTGKTMSIAMDTPEGRQAIMTNCEREKGEFVIGFMSGRHQTPQDRKLLCLASNNTWRDFIECGDEADRELFR